MGVRNYPLFNMCLNPKWIFKTGNRKSTTYKGNEGSYYEIGLYSQCGHCEQCINSKANDWVVRNYFEEKSHQKKCFITLTYRNNPVIIVKKDLQDFMKRFRTYLDRHENGVKIRMYACQEYGETRNRPHAHIIIYGWEDENAEYLGINTRKNIVYQSKIIQKIWGLGRTSYQKFSEKEAPYISLYNTAKETYKRAVILNREKIKKLETWIRNRSNIYKKQTKNILKELKDLKKELEISKTEYMAVREYNTWSIALGWEEFEKDFLKNSENYVFETYIGDKTFPTPSPWIKKLANQGYYCAIKEMERREEEIEQSASEEEERRKAIERVESRRKKELQEHLESQKDGGKVL